MKGQRLNGWLIIRFKPIRDDEAVNRFFGMIVYLIVYDQIIQGGIIQSGR